MADELPILGKAIIRELVAKNQNDKVIEALINLARKIENKDLSNSIILLSSKFENYVKDSRNGVLSHEQQEQSLAKLNEAILELIDDLPEDAFHQVNESNTKKGKQVSTVSEDKMEDKVMKYMILALFIFGFLGLICSMVYLAIVFMAKNRPDFDFTYLILPIASLTVVFTGGLFYFINKSK